MDLKITIIRKANGTITVDGPIGDKATAYGILEAAKDAIQEHHLRMQAAAKVEAVADGAGKQFLAALGGGSHVGSD